jgi:murein DD-endopeptidase MepM/ murein hydrolase activator NlpD
LRKETAMVRLFVASILAVLLSSSVMARPARGKSAHKVATKRAAQRITGKRATRKLATKSTPREGRVSSRRRRSQAEQEPRTARYQEKRATDRQAPAPAIDRTNMEAEVVVPPAPSVLKKNPNSIVIPRQESPLKPRFEEKSAVATNAKVGSSFGYRRDPFTRRAKFHSGLDIKARLGDPVGASSNGVVQYAGWYHGYGNVVIVNHGGGVATHYAHLSSFAVEVGQDVTRGSILGYAGSTGRSTSPHLHYEVRIEGNAVNPLDPVALDGSSDFFKKFTAVSNIQPKTPEPLAAVEDKKTPGPLASGEDNGGNPLAPLAVVGGSSDKAPALVQGLKKVEQPKVKKKSSCVM